jgi:hypothetical protein
MQHFSMCSFAQAEISGQIWWSSTGKKLLRCDIA